MICLLLGITIGLVVGWNFLPQPEIVKNWIAQLRAKV
jgi:hypothetical protein